jgi:predicted glycogen debranching enzyme
VRATGDLEFVRELYPVLESIIEWHIRGTRYGIRMDPTDSLLMSGVPGVQLTWMDAKVGDWVVTPRTGKAVEINALWINALTILRGFALKLGKGTKAQDYADILSRADASFANQFWFAEGGYLYDVVDGPNGDDATLRPNQLIVLSLRADLLSDDRARSIVDICARELWTPVGLRSLGPQHPDYSPIYAGSPQQRDAIYHQGVAWSWLLGAFALAHYRVYRNRELALSYLNGIDTHLSTGCIGQVTEIADAESPFTPRGCFAQAWGVAEILRAWNQINENEI